MYEVGYICHSLWQRQSCGKMDLHLYEKLRIQCLNQKWMKLWHLYTDLYIINQTWELQNRWGIWAAILLSFLHGLSIYLELENSLLLQNQQRFLLTCKICLKGTLSYREFRARNFLCGCSWALYICTYSAVWKISQPKLCFLV